MSKTYFKKPSKKILSFILIGVVFLGAIIGSGFGISHYTHKDDEGHTQYNTAPIMDDHYQITMRVDGLEQSNYSLEQLAKGIDQGFDVAGVDQAIVLTSNNDELMINLPLNFLDDDNPFSFDSIEQLQKGLAIAYGYSFVSEPLEFRTLEGKTMFKTAGGSSSFDYEVNQDSFIGTEVTEEGTETLQSGVGQTYATLPSAPIEDDTGYKLIASSDVKYHGGQAYFKLELNDEEYLDLAIEASNLLVSGGQSNSMLSTAYMWTGYDIYETLVKQFDESGYAMAQGASETNQITIQGEAENPEEAPTETAFTVDPLLIYAFMDPQESEIKGSAQIDQDNIIKRTSAKPFLLTETEVHQAVSIFNKDFIEWTPTAALSSTESQLVNEKINYAANSSLSFDYISSSFIYNEKNENAIKILFWTFATVIILLALFMIWYLGLLGLIADMLLSILAMIFIILGAVSGVAAGFLFISTVFFLLLASCGFVVIITNRFKYNNDTSSSPLKKYKTNFAKLVNNNLIPLGLIVIFLFIFGLIAPLWIGINAFLAIVFLALIVTFFFGIFPFILYLLDKWLAYSTTPRDKNFANWNFVTGSVIAIQSVEAEHYFRKLDILQSEKMAKAFGIVLVFAVIITFGFFGVVAGITGSGINNADNQRASFKYNVVMQISNNVSTNDATLDQIKETDETVLENEEYLWHFGKDEINNGGRQTPSNTIPWVDTSSDNPDEGGYLVVDDPYGQADIFSFGLNYEKNITKIFNDNHIKVEQTSAVRNDHFGFENKGDLETLDVPYWEYGFGYQISSYDKMTEEKAEAIENSLNNPYYNETTDVYEPISELEIKNGYNIADDNITINFSLQEQTGSLADITGDEEGTSLSVFTPYTQSHDGYQVILALFAAVSALILFAWIMYGWTDAALMFGLLFGELFLAFMAVFVLWIPFGIGFWLALSGLGLLSLISKLTISSRATKKIKSHDKADLKFYKKAYYRSSKQLFMLQLIIWGFGFGIFTIAIAYIGTAAAAGLFLFLFIPPIIIIINFTFYPLLSATYHYKKDERKKQRILKDIEVSKDPQELSEEYISGVNM